MNVVNFILKSFDVIYSLRKTKPKNVKSFMKTSKVCR